MQISNKWLKYLEAVEGLPKFGKVEKTICGACQMGKQTKASHHKVNVIATSRCLELLHVDPMGPTRTESLGGKRYIMVIVNDFSRYTWVEFLRQKSEACEKLEILYKRLQNEKGAPIVRRMGSKRNFQPPKLLNKMGWLRGKIGSFKKWQELCYSTSKFLKSFREKP